MLGCGSALLIFLLTASVVGFLVARDPHQLRGVLGALFDSLENSLEKNFAPDVAPADRQEFRAARERFHAAWEAGKIDMRGTDALRRRLLEESRKPRLGPADVRELSRFLDRLAGAPAARAA
jgi:hypothetical protein